MKTIWILFLGATLTLFSCSSNDDDQIDVNFVTAELNSIPWTGQPEINIDGDTLIFLGIGNEQVVVFKIKFEGEGSYLLQGQQSIFYTTVGQDALTSQFILDNGKDSRVTITDYDAETGSLTGSFELTLAQEWSNPEIDTQTIIFSNGRFNGLVNQFD